MNIKNVKQIVSKQGDQGTSRDYSNREFKKNDILFEVLGTIDELSSHLGLAYHFTNCKDLIVIQKDLQKLGAQIATDPMSERYASLLKVEAVSVNWLENLMQDYLDKNPLEPKFALPGSEKSLNGAYIDVARTVARRAERRLVDLVFEHSRADLEIAQSYLNRLSDYLFILSCNL